MNRLRWLAVVGALCCLGADSTDSAAVFQLQVPAGFVVAPQLTAAAKQATPSGSTVTRTAWQHTTLGCFALLQTTTAARDTSPKTLHKSVADAVVAQGATVSDYHFGPQHNQHVSRFRLDRKNLRGKAVTRSVLTDATVEVGFAACFYGPHRAARCELLCDDLLERFEK